MGFINSPLRGTVTEVQFSSFKEGIYVIAKSHMRSTPSLSSLPQRCIWNGSSLRLTDDGSLSSFHGKTSRASAFHDGLGFVPAGSVSSFLTLHSYREASHLWGLPCLSVCLLGRFSFTPAYPGQYTHRCFRRCRPPTHSSLGFPYYFALFEASSLNMWGGWFLWKKETQNW